MTKKSFLYPFILIIFISIIAGCEKKVIEVRYAPVLFDPAAPDSMQKGSPDSSYLAISAFDPDGLDDIDSVFYIVTRPDGTSNGIRFPMRDDGSGGDSTASDGRYVYMLPSPLASSQSGDYTFTFYGYDSQQNKSNTPSKIITAY